MSLRLWAARSFYATMKAEKRNEDDGGHDGVSHGVLARIRHGEK